MADSYVDLALASGANDGSDWTNAYHTTTPIENGLSDAGAGGRCFVKTDASATNKDTAASLRRIWPASTLGNQTQLIGCKSGTTNEPPVDADVCVRGTDNLPIFEATAGNIEFRNEVVVTGIKFDTNADITIGASGTSMIFQDCELAAGDDFLFSSSSVLGPVMARNCEFIFGSTGSTFNLVWQNVMEIYGGITSGSIPTNLVSGSGQRLTAMGLDFSHTTGTNLALTSSSVYGPGPKFINCRTPSSYTRISGTPPNTSYGVELIQSSNASGISSGASIRDYEKETYSGVIAHETTAIRTGGSDDGASGGFSFALTPTVNRTLEGAVGIATPWMEAWIAGDGSTSFDITAYIANSGGADYNTDDAVLEIMSPNETGTTDHLYTRVGDIVSGSSTPITDDAVSSWGTGGNNPQALSASVTPDYEGVVYARVHFMKRFSSSPETLYVDGKLDVT